jgi:CrcB protein
VADPAGPHPGLALLAVGIGGVIGSLARAALTVALPHDPGTWAWSTSVVNATGCFALAALLAVLPPHRPYARLLVGTGVLGSYTTFSAFSVDAVQLLDRGRAATAGAYAVLSVVVMLAAALAGRRAAARLVRRATP